jgi:hypothetical protein
MRKNRFLRETKPPLLTCDYNVGMFHRFSARRTVLFASLALVSSFVALRAQDANTQHLRKYKTPPPAARIEVTVVRDFNGKPIEDAHVIFHPIEGDKDKGYLELKSNEEGKAVIDVLPIGDTVRMQVIVNGYQTYGQDYKVDKPEMSLEVRMKRPGAQYSIYKDNSTTPKSDNNSGSSNSGTDKSANPSQDAKPPASSNSPSGSSNQSGSQQNSNQSQPKSN